MTIRVAINGLGRIGRAILKLVEDEPAFELVAVNDLVEAGNLAYLLRFDTVYGRYAKPVAVDGGNLALGERKIRANVVAPGAIETDFSGGLVRDNEEVNQRISSVTALGRVGLPGDIGGVVAFLSTDDAYWINGQRIEVSGGQAL